MQHRHCCDRCHESLGRYEERDLSWFNMDMICSKCMLQEECHNDIQRAKTADKDAYMRRDMEFKGIGLPDDLRLESKKPRQRLLRGLRMLPIEEPAPKDDFVPPHQTYGSGTLFELRLYGVYIGAVRFNVDGTAWIEGGDLYPDFPTAFNALIYQETKDE